MPQTLILQSCGERNRLHSELMCFGSHISSSVTAEGPTQPGNLRDTVGPSFSVHSGSEDLHWGPGQVSPQKSIEIRNTSCQSMNMTLILSQQETLKRGICART